jgi:hypothetical protein
MLSLSEDEQVEAPTAFLRASSCHIVFILLHSYTTLEMKIDNIETPRTPPTLLFSSSFFRGEDSEGFVPCGNGLKEKRIPSLCLTLG